MYGRPDITTVVKDTYEIASRMSLCCAACFTGRITI